MQPAAKIRRNVRQERGFPRLLSPKGWPIRFERRVPRLSVPIPMVPSLRIGPIVLFAVPVVAALAAGQGESPPRERGGIGGTPEGFGPGGLPGVGEPEWQLVSRFDADGDGMLDGGERAAARAYVKEERAKSRGRSGLRSPPMSGGRAGPPAPGARVNPKDVKIFPDAPPYDPGVLRTVFLDFETEDWESELEDFKGTDVDVPAALTIDGTKVPRAGVKFRGTSSYFMVERGYKRSLNVRVDAYEKGRRVLGVKTFNLLNANGDPTFLRAALYSAIARRYLPTPSVNLVKVVINGENWGIYVNQEQFDKRFLKQWFGSAQGVRWKVPGSPRGGGGLAYRGDDVAAYERLYEIKSEDEKGTGDAWRALVHLCAVLEKTPAEELEKSLTPILDVDGVLRFLAVENVLMNEDGYWTRASDFSLYRDAAGTFHVVPHDINEAFLPAGGPGFPGGPFGRRGPRPPGGGGPEFDGGGPPLAGEGRPGEGPPRPESRPGRRGPGGMALAPLAGVGDSDKPLLTKLLAVPALKERYLRYVKTIAENDLDWTKIAPVVNAYAELVGAEVQADTKKLDGYDAFVSGLGLGAETAAARPVGRRPLPSLRQFIEERRAFLLSHPDLVNVKAVVPADRAKKP